VRDPTWADTLLAVILIAWGLFVVFGGLAAIGWWLGGLFSTEPGSPHRHDPDPPPVDSWPTNLPQSGEVTTSCTTTRTRWTRS